jgi:hypothetical protein
MKEEWMNSNNPVTSEEFKKRMQVIKDGEYDPEAQHIDADKLLCQVLRELGYGTGIDIYGSIDKWYA